MNIVLGITGSIAAYKAAELAATQRNVIRLEEDGCQFVDPAEGDLACGYEGIGRLAPVEEILERVAAIFSAQASSPTQ